MICNRGETMAMTTAPEKVYKVREVAHQWGCDQDTIYRMIREDKLRAIRIGRLLRVPESALADFIAGR